MGNCCGPFKRGRPAKAVVPSQQCFADCCGNLCPPEGCCDSVKVQFQCGCECECNHIGYNFGGLRFKKKKKKRVTIPKFSKKTLVANGFTFADGTVPTPPSSSSSSSSGDCCDWDGNTVIFFGEECNGLKEPIRLDKIGPNTWYGTGTLTCGDGYRATITCDPEVPYDGPESCITKWFLDLTIDCVEGLTLEGFHEECSCNAPPIWKWSGDVYKCNCCSPPTSSSSSSCECNPLEVTLTTTGCCLYVAAGGIEAVGSGMVQAEYQHPGLQGCEFQVKLNGQADSVEVDDGEPISIEVDSNCQCCEIGQDCNSQLSSMWVQKSKEDRKTIVMNKKELLDKVRFAAKRVRGKRFRRGP